MNLTMDQKKILVVDDEPIGRQLLQAVLLPEGYDVYMAENGMEAIDKMKSFQPDLVLLDVMMPGMDGYETMRKVKLDPEINHIPVIYITALDDRDSRIRGLESGANDYIAKPFDRIEILTKIKNLISKSSSEKPVSSSSVSQKSITPEILSGIASQFYDRENHNSAFSGSFKFADSKQSATLVYGWHSKKDGIEMHCFFGPVQNHDLSPVGVLLIYGWLQKFANDIPMQASLVSNYLNTNIKNSNLLSNENKTWWNVIFISKPDGNWMLSGTNQVLFSKSPVNTVIETHDSGNSVKISSDTEVSIKKGAEVYFFYSDIVNACKESDIINSMQQSNSLDFAHEFLMAKANTLNSFALEIVF